MTPGGHLLAGRPLWPEVSASWGREYSRGKKSKKVKRGRGRETGCKEKKRQVDEK